MSLYFIAIDWYLSVPAYEWVLWIIFLLPVSHNWTFITGPFVILISLVQNSTDIVGIVWPTVPFTYIINRQVFPTPDWPTMITTHLYSIFYSYLYILEYNQLIHSIDHCSLIIINSLSIQILLIELQKFLIAIAINSFESRRYKYE